MAIKSVKFKNCKSLKDISLNINDLNLLIGENGTGKTNIIKALDYFYSNLTEDNFNEELYDKNNPYSQYFEITVEYDLSLLTMEGFDHNKNRYSKDLDEYVDRFDFLTNDTVVLNLKQYKDEKPNWNKKFKIRRALKHLYPFYFFRSNNIDPSDWQLLWNIIGDLSRLNVKSKTKINGFISDLINGSNADQDRLINRENEMIIKFLKTKLKDEKINLKEFNTKEIFTILSQLHLGGKTLKKDNKAFDYYSDGTNLFEYLKIVIDIVKKIAEKKLAEPIILIDEPEMGLHNNFIDRLSKKIAKSTDCGIEYFIATHSPRFTKHLLKKENSNIFHFRLKDNYSSISKMKTTQLENQYNIITDREASLLFAKAIVFLEGDSDLELFLNENILTLYPFLSKVEFYHNLSEIKKEALLTPNENSYAVPHLFVVDMDSVIQYSQKKFVVQKRNKDLNLLKIKSEDSNDNIKIKEKYLYGAGRKRILKHHKRIQRLLNKDYDFDKFLYTGKDLGEFNYLQDQIKSYFIEYNIFVNYTTIEGILINKTNYEIFYKWILIEDENDQSLSNDLKTIFDKYTKDPEFQVTIFRLMVKGKLNSQKKFKYRKNDDNIDRKNEFIEKYKGELETEEAEEILEIVERVWGSFSKTDGWMTRFLNYYFDRHNKKFSKEKFENVFPELTNLLDKINSLI